MSEFIRRVERLPLDPGPAAWNELLVREQPRPSLCDAVTADWVIVGAGFTGLSAARRLSELHPTDHIVVLEAGGIAQGPAGRNSGFMIDLPHVLTSNNYSGAINSDKSDIKLNRAGIDYAMAAKNDFNFSDETIALSGKINGAVTQKGRAHNEDYANYLTHLSEPFDVLDRRAMKKLTGSDVYLNGIFTPGTAMIQPALFIRGLAQAIENQNVVLYEGSPAVEVRKQRGGWCIQCPNGRVSCAKVILAVNGHLESFGYYTNQLMHIHTYGSMTEALTPEQMQRLGGHSRWSLTPADPMGTTVRRISGTGGDRIVVRNRVSFDPTLQVRRSWLSSVSRTHDRSFAYRFPMLSDVKMAYRWGGRLCLSRNDVPVFGEIDDGLVAACCQNGLGTAKGTIAGKLAAEMASGESNELIDDLSARAEPIPLPSKPFASMGANAFIRWGEWRAGDEL